MKRSQSNRTPKHNKTGRRASYKDYARILREQKKLLGQRFHVKEIGIFGSYVCGEQLKRSDLDILVDFEEIPDLGVFMGLADYLETILKKKVDLVRKPVIRKELREQVLNEVVYI